MCDSRGMTLGPSGEEVRLSGGGYEAVVVAVGAGLRTLRRDGVDLVAGYPADQMSQAGRGQLLIPWPNRVRGGSYDFAGEQLQLPLTEVPKRNAIHGLTRWATWSQAERTPSTAEWRYRLAAQPGYPWSLELRVSYAVGDGGLEVAIEARNDGSQPAPYGHGAHPYLTVGRKVDDCELLLPAATYSPVDDQGIPVGFRPVDGTPYDFRELSVIGDLQLDHPYGDLPTTAEATTTVELHDPDTGRSVRLWADETHRWLQAFTGDGLGERAREALAVEPMTCPPDAFNSGVGLVVLQPGESHLGRFGIG